LKDWNTVVDSATEAEYTTHLTEFKKHQKDAVSYAVDTWLELWKEKIVQYWVDINLHFGIQFTSSIEGCYAVLKAYLKVSTDDLKDVFNCLIHFWPTQHQNILNSISQEQNKIKHKLNKVYFYLVQSLVCDQALSLILVKYTKLHRVRAQHSNNLPLCNCTIKASMGLLCYHTVAEHLASPGHLLPEDIYPFW
jgi:hypothetical protein